MSMSVASAETAVRVTTGLGDSRQIDTAEMAFIIDQAYRRALRKLAVEAPRLNALEASYSSVTDGMLAKPTALLSVVALEYVISTTRFEPVIRGNGINRGAAAGASTPVNFKLTYTPAPTAGYTDLSLLPEDLENVVVQWAAAEVQVRRKQDPAPHLSTARDQWQDVIKGLRQRYGNSPGGGLRLSRHATFSYVEVGANLIVTERNEGWS